MLLNRSILYLTEALQAVLRKEDKTMKNIIISGKIYNHNAEHETADFIAVYTINDYIVSNEDIVKAMFEITRDYELRFYLNDNDEVAEVPEDFITYSPMQFANWLEDNTNCSIEDWSTQWVNVLR